MAESMTADDVQVSTARPKPETRTKRQPPYAVIVENDDYHTFDYVIDVLQRVCGRNLTDAEQLAWEVHNKGRAAVWNGSLEVAELKRDQVRGFGPDAYATRPVNFPLGCTVEPMPGD